MIPGIRGIALGLLAAVVLAGQPVQRGNVTSCSTVHFGAGIGDRLPAPPGSKILTRRQWNQGYNAPAPRQGYRVPTYVTVLCLDQSLLGGNLRVCIAHGPCFPMLALHSGRGS